MTIEYKTLSAGNKIVTGTFEDWEEDMKNNKIKLRNRIFFFSIALMLLYMIIEFFVSTEVFQVDTLHNFLTGLFFFLIGLIVFSIISFRESIRKKVNPVYYKYLLVLGAAYLAFSKLFNLIGMALIQDDIFTAVHIVVFLIYSLLSTFAFTFFTQNGKDIK